MTRSRPVARRQAGVHHFIVHTCAQLKASCNARQWPEALAYYTQALEIGCTLSANYGRGLARCLEGLASVAIAREQAPCAVFRHPRADAPASPAEPGRQRRIVQRPDRGIRP